MKIYIFSLAFFFLSANSFAAPIDSSTSDLVNYFHTSSLDAIEEPLNSCQQPRIVLDKKIYHTGFWDDINTIRQLTDNKLNNVKLNNYLKIEVVGDNLQLLTSQPIDLYNKSKKILLSKGLLLTYETTFIDRSNTKRYLSIFKKPKYSIQDIQININKLTAEQGIVYNQVESCIKQVLNEKNIEKLTLDNDRKMLILNDHFYQNHPEFKKDKVLEKIYSYQTDKSLYFNPFLQEKVLKDMLVTYSIDSRKILTQIFNASMNKSYVKKDGVDRELRGLFEGLFFWKKESKQAIQNMIYYQYDSVNFNH